MSHGCTVAEDFASLMMADVLMTMSMMMRDAGERSIAGWCLVKLRWFRVEEVVMVALPSDLKEGSSNSHFPLQYSSWRHHSFCFLVHNQ